MIYADSSFLFSLYALDGHSRRAQEIYTQDARRPLAFTSWQRFELRNTIRLAANRLSRADLTVPFQQGNVFKRIDGDLSTGRLRHIESDWRATLEVAESLSEKHTIALGTAAMDLWHVASAILLEADTFWTFDDDQRELALATKKFRAVR